MTNTRKLEILWDLYFIAVGLDTLMTADEIMDTMYDDDYMPQGFCCAMDLLGYDVCDEHEIIDIVLEFRISTGSFHYPRAYWHIRSKALLKAIKKVSKEIKQ